MHIFGFHNYIEILDDDNQPVSENEEGRVVVTNLHNYAMPFIRCEIGDMAILGPRKCNCGCSLPSIRTVTGRSGEVLIAINGEKISPCFIPYLFYPDCIDSALGIEQYQRIKQFQVIQDKKEKIAIKIVKAQEASEDEFLYIVDNFRKYLGNDMKIEMSFVNLIPSQPSGKRCYVISNINKAKDGSNV
jgi:phenylacetate-CoA ligase